MTDPSGTNDMAAAHAAIPSVDRLLRSAREVGALDGDAIAALWRSYVDGSGATSYSRIWSLLVLSDWCVRHRVHA